MSKIYLIRHGQASFLSDDYDNLSKKGMVQSEALGDYFLNNQIHFDKIYIGNLKRHQQTFEGFSKPFVAKGHAFTNPLYLKELNEHQALEAFSSAYEDFISKNESAQNLFHSIDKDPNLKKRNLTLIFGLFFKEFVSGIYPKNGSSIQPWSEFREQTKKGISTILNNTNKGETIGVFTSGGTKSSIIGDCLGLEEEKISELNLAIRNTSFSQLHFSKNQLKTFSINEISHLTKEQITFV